MKDFLWNAAPVFVILAILGVELGVVFGWVVLIQLFVSDYSTTCDPVVCACECENEPLRICTFDGDGTWCNTATRTPQTEIFP